MADSSVFPPAGLTALALDSNVELAWQPVSNANGYTVLRGTSSSNINQVLASDVATTSYTDSSATDGTTYYYTVEATASDGSGNTAPSTTVSATPVVRSCNSGNAIVLENCYPGSTGWKLSGPLGPPNGIEGFATQNSINAGGNVGLKVNTAGGAPYHIDIYRTGYYGGAQGRLISSIQGLVGVAQPRCQSDSTTGLVDCSNWSTSVTLSTTADWPSGVYLLQLVRDDNGNDNEILLTVRNDSSNSKVVFSVPVTTYEAYNAYGGKSLYDYNSSGATTVSGTARAVQVSFDRPYDATVVPYQNFYTQSDIQWVTWLEQQGYDVSYITNADLETAGPQLLDNHTAFVNGSHDEYWSAAMRSAVTSARDAGVSLLWGGNAVYWKIRFTSSPYSGASGRVEVCYKSTQSGGPDPSGIPTSTWRDPAGANDPENSLLGEMYVGDNDTVYFPLGVSASQGSNRFWRHTSLSSMAPGTSTTLGKYLVGWEWDAPAANGDAPSNLTTLASSPVTGELIQNNGAYYVSGSTNVVATSYQAASGAMVYDLGTNQWARGLAYNMVGVGEPNQFIQQATVNALEDMGARPTTPSSGLVVDPAGAPSVTSTTPSSGATSVSPKSTVTATFDRDIDPATLTGQTFTLTDANGNSVGATVTYNATTDTATLVPASALNAFTTYTATLTTGVEAWNRTGLSAAVTWSFTTGAGTPPSVTAQTPANGATAVATTSAVTASFDRPLNPGTVNGQTFTLTAAGGSAVAATVTYNSGSSIATLTPSAPLIPSAQYTATLSTGIQAVDGTALSSPVTWSFTTRAALTVTSQTPAPQATGISPNAAVRAVFSRAANPTTITGQTFTLTDPNGNSVPATVSYDSSTNTASLTPTAPLALQTTYTATVTAVTATDGGTLASPISWAFTTAPTNPPIPTVTTMAPAAATTNVAMTASVAATFNVGLDSATVNAGSFRLTDPSGNGVPATVTYNAATMTATLTPNAPLNPATLYTAALSTAIRSTTEEPMASSMTWTFTTANCPCSLMSGAATPQLTGLSTKDGRSGSGPFSYELGVKVTVSQPVQLVAFTFYKDAAETGTHIGHLWSSSGALLAQATFQWETPSGWQRQALASPVTLQPGQTYVISVSVNSTFVETQYGLQNQLAGGPLSSVADGANGVFGASAGTFPNQSYHSTNYFVDGVVIFPGSNQTPHVTGENPASGATNVGAGSLVTAAFSTSLDPVTVNSQTFTLTDPNGQSVPAAVSYSDATHTATLWPVAGLLAGATYTAQLTTGIRAFDETPLPSATTWSFTTSSSPAVTSTSPSAGATLISPLTNVQATFVGSLDPATVNGQTFTLTGPGGQTTPAAVSYSDATHTVTLTPQTALAPSTSYTAQLTTGIMSSVETPLGAPYSWSFTTSSCPCSLLTGSAAPAQTNLPTKDGRSGNGPWSLELGVKIQVSQPAQLTAIRFYKDAHETGTHIGRLWSSSGSLITQVTFQGETTSGWQQQALPTSVTLQPGQTYVISVGVNSTFVDTASGLQNKITNGPLSSVADAANGVFALAAGSFPNQTYHSSNYFVDAVIT